MSEEESGVQKLEKLLGHDPSKPFTGGGILQEAMEEIKADRIRDAKNKAKEMLTKAMELHQAILKADQEWKAKIAKFNKELGKILSAVESFGQEDPNSNKK